MKNIPKLSPYEPTPNMLDERCILVTGAGDGIGRALALEAAKLGATTILADKQVAGLESLYDEIVEINAPEPAIIPLDLLGANLDDYLTVATSVEQAFGRLDGLVNNAGWLGAYTPFEQHDMRLYQDTMMINLHAPFMLTQAMLPLLKKSDDPSVVFSTHEHDFAYAGAFGIAKGGLLSMMRILADEYDIEDKPIRFNAVDAAVVDTQMRRLNFPGEEWGKNPKPADVIAPYLYFLGPESRGITGINYRRES